LVDLFSTNLNEVGDIRTVDPRTTLHHWRRISDRGGVDRAGALRVGRAVRAGSVLLGSVVEAGGKVRMTAELVDLDGKVLATATGDAPADSVFSLVDRLSVSLLNEIWRPNQPVPNLRLSAITTRSPSALRAFLRGEQFYRRSQWDSARQFLEQAVTQDSTFALAHFRLGELYGWTESLASAGARRYSATAQRLSDRLPAREKSLVVAHRLHEDGEIEAIDSLRAFLTRFPDDAVGWYMLGDAQFHAAFVIGLTAPQLYEPFDRAIQLDSSFTPALQHPLEVSAQSGDSVSFHRYLRALESVSRDSSEVRFFRTLGRVRWGSPEQRQTAFRVGVRTSLRVPADGARLLTALINANLSDPKPDYNQIMTALDSVRIAVASIPAFVTGIDLRRTQTAIAFGRYARASVLLDSLRMVNGDFAMGAALLARSSGMAPPDFGETDIQRLKKAPLTYPIVPYWRALLALAENNLTEVRSLLNAAPRDTTAIVTPDMYDAVAAWLTAVEGDTAAALPRLEAATHRAGYKPVTTNLSAPLYFARTTFQLRNPEKRERAFGHLRYLLANDPTIELIAPLRLGEALERAGKQEEAARVYGHALTALEGADPGIQANVTALRNALARLRAER
jgi:tetratricopeptide (TPR) repeat protein